MVPYLVLIGACVLVGFVVHNMLSSKFGTNVPWTIGHASTMVIYGCIVCFIIILLGGFR